MAIPTVLTVSKDLTTETTLLDWWIIFMWTVGTLTAGWEGAILLPAERPLLWVLCVSSLLRAARLTLSLVTRASRAARLPGDTVNCPPLLNLQWHTVHSKIIMLTTYSHKMVFPQLMYFFIFLQSVTALKLFFCISWFFIKKNIGWIWFYRVESWLNQYKQCEININCN